MMTAGSPGVTCSSAKTAMATTPITGMVATRRRTISGTTTSGDRHVPEQRRRELEHAAHRLAVGGRQDPLAERHVHHLVVGDLLDLLGELLLLRAVGGARPLNLELLDASALRPAEPRA